jgi:DNA polymerase V
MFLLLSFDFCTIIFYEEREGEMRGGKREGAGRPEGSGKFGEPTKAIRIPISQEEKVRKWLSEKGGGFPLYQCSVAAGFPSPAEGEVERKLDLNELLVLHPQATFFVRVSGSSMIKAGIHHNDILVVDRSLEPSHGKVVIAVVNGELTVKRLYRKGKKIELVAENEGYPPIVIGDAMDLHIWGVVTNVIHPL